MPIVEEKFLKAIRAGIICGIPPALAFVIFLSTIFPVFNFYVFPLFFVFMFIHASAIWGSVILAIHYSRPLLHNFNDVVLVSGISGASNGITFTSIIFIPIIMWISLGILHIGVELFSGAFLFFMVSCIFAVSLINALTAAAIGAICKIAKIVKVE